MTPTVVCVCGRTIGRTRTGLWAHTANPGPAHHYARPRPAECPGILPYGDGGREVCNGCGREVYRVRGVRLFYRHRTA
jgi:hypothetical protein